MNASATRLVVQRYEDALHQIARLKRENNDLQETVRSNEIKTIRLVDHYKKEIDSQTNTALRLKGELRSLMLKREQSRQDKYTWIEEDELRSKENELINVIYLLEDEIQALKADKEKQSEEFRRKNLVNEANVKQSFLHDIDTFRTQISNELCVEVKDALEGTIADNDRLKSNFRALLGELENLQASRDMKHRELLRTRRELDLLRGEHTLLLARAEHNEQEQLLPDLATHSDLTTSSDDEILEGEDTSRHGKATRGSSLEDYFTRCIRQS